MGVCLCGRIRAKGLHLWLGNVMKITVSGGYRVWPSYINYITLGYLYVNDCQSWFRIGVLCRYVTQRNGSLALVPSLFEVEPYFMNSVLCVVLTYQVKPLGVIWGRFPQWSKANTIMFDDLRRNFIMNPQNGLKVFSCIIFMLELYRYNRL